MIVVDTNVIAYLLIQGAKTAKAERLFKRDPEWAAPALWRSEMRNVLSLYVRKGLMTLPKALEIMQEGIELVGALEWDVPSEDVLRLAASSRRSAYDCEFVALVRMLEVPLHTADAALARAFPGCAIFLE